MFRMDPEHEVMCPTSAGIATGLEAQCLLHHLRCDIGDDLGRYIVADLSEPQEDRLQPQCSAFGIRCIGAQVRDQRRHLVRFRAAEIRADDANQSIHPV
jgi:hypothetical protein